MRYQNDRSLCFNLTKKLGKASERFNYLGASKIVKKLPSKTSNGTICAHDVILGKDGDTMCIVSLQSYSTNLPVVKNGRLIEKGERRVVDLMVASHSLSELDTTFESVVSKGLNAEWVPGNAQYFNSESSDIPVLEALDAIRRYMRV